MAADDFIMRTLNLIPDQILFLSTVIVNQTMIIRIQLKCS